MKIKRIFAPDMRQAIRLVREELGSDAVILSNKNVEGGVEIVAARDYDEQQVKNRVQQQESQTSVVPTSQLKPVNWSAQQQSLKPKKSVAKPQKSAAAKPKIEWSQEPALIEMKKELKQMRQSIDTHLSQVGWEASARNNPIRIDLLKRMRMADFSIELSMKLANGVSETEDADTVWRKALGEIAGQLPTIEDNLLDYGGVIALVGPTGVGKTTTIAKLAARYKLAHGSRHIALVTIDNYRIAAHEQLSTYGRILDIPVRTASNSAELNNILNSFIDKRLVLIDTAGMGPHDERLVKQFALLRESTVPIKPYLVMSATTQARGIEAVIKTFQHVGPQAAILTKLDEAYTLGATVSALIKNQLPLAWVTDGQNVPEDLHIARPNKLLNRCVAPVNTSYNLGNVGDYETWVAQANV